MASRVEVDLAELLPAFVSCIQHPLCHVQAVPCASQHQLLDAVEVVTERMAFAGNYFIACIEVESVGHFVTILSFSFTNTR